MNAENFNVDALLTMAHSPIKNYAVPGLESWLIGSPSEAGTVRLFQCDREQQEAITPHSHRFDFQCWVLRGEVKNRVWNMTCDSDPCGDFFQRTKLVYGGDVGRYKEEGKEVGKWNFVDSIFSRGQCYSMRSHEIHSIFFSRGSVVLFFEAASKSDHSYILQPFVDSEVVPTFKVEPWMFKKAPAA